MALICTDDCFDYTVIFYKLVAAGLNIISVQLADFPLVVNQGNRFVQLVFLRNRDE